MSFPKHHHQGLEFLKTKTVKFSDKEELKVFLGSFDAFSIFNSNITELFLWCEQPFDPAAKQKAHTKDFLF